MTDQGTIERIEVADRYRQRLQIDTEVARRVLTRFIYTELTKVGFNRAVVGLSGGVDSAVSCYLAAEAMGPSNVLALRLPYESSSPSSLEHAQMIIDDLGVESETVDITPIVEPLFQVSPGITDHRKGNVMARARMTIIYDRSAAWDALAIGTSNKTELLLGYGTVYGDLASAINPIGDLYKTQLRQLAHTLGVPQVIIDKAPSADLIPGQTDEGDFGFTYDAVDPLLYLLVDERYLPEEAIAAGFPAPFIKTVLRMMRTSHFKRTLPVIPKLSARTVGHDFRYLRDWGT
ncbi:MAG TPA: NAD+ synthase [Candidatus Sulfomarinibacteraceae bacterium]|nr:NAD+ synthase [Candidatus Sulfomarinibacteraceae bacterium]